MFRCKTYGPYIIQKNCEDGSVVVKHIEDSKVFSVKNKELRVLLVTYKESKMVSLMLAGP